MFYIGHTIMLGVIAIACVLGVFSWKYNDTWLQRVGMVVTCFAAVAGIAHGATGQPPAAVHLHLIAYGVGIYALATVIKRWSRKPWNGSTAQIDWQAIRASVGTWDEERLESAIMYGITQRSQRMGLDILDSPETRPQR